MVEVAKVAFSSVSLACLPDIWAFLKCADENLLDSKSFTLQRKRELKNLDGDVSKRIVRLQFVFYDVQSRFWNRKGLVAVWDVLNRALGTDLSLASK